MLPVTSASLRLFLHILGAAVWVGGQIVLAGIVSVVRPYGPDATRAVARRFQYLAWSGFGLLLATGVWNLLAVHPSDQSTAWLTTLFVKLLLVGISAACAIGHVVVTRHRPAVGGALAGIALLAALGAVLLGVMLTTG